MSTPEKRLKTPVKLSGTPRKRKQSKQETISDKSFQFFHDKIQREEDGVLKDYYECRRCGKQICGSNPSNLASHLYYKHRDVYQNHIGKLKESIPVKRLKLLQNCVSIVALNGRPFTALTDVGFQNIVSSKLDKFHVAGHPLDLKSSSQPEVHQHLHQTAVKVRECIKKEVKNRPLSILLDIGTRQKRSMLGISVQFIKNSAVQVRSIGMIELTNRHTAANLAMVVKDCLKEYEIQKHQIISITADNGANVLKMVKDLRLILADELANRPTVSAQLDFGTSSVDDIYSEEDTDNDIAAVLNRGEINDDDVAIGLILSEEDEIDPILLREQQNLLCATVGDLMNENDIDNLFDVTGVNCAAHTLQLAIKDGLAALPESVRNVISLCRRTAKILRLKTTKYDLNSAGITYNVPHMEVPTRWGSMYRMVSKIKYSTVDSFYFVNCFNLFS